jgi:hypothetical protein
MARSFRIPAVRQRHHLQALTSAPSQGRAPLPCGWGFSFLFRSKFNTS